MPSRIIMDLGALHAREFPASVPVFQETNVDVGRSGIPLDEQNLLVGIEHGDQFGRARARLAQGARPRPARSEFRCRQSPANTWVNQSHPVGVDSLVAEFLINTRRCVMSTGSPKILSCALLTVMLVAVSACTSSNNPPQAATPRDAATVPSPINNQTNQDITNRGSRGD